MTALAILAVWFAWLPLVLDDPVWTGLWLASLGGILLWRPWSSRP